MRLVGRARDIVTPQDGGPPLVRVEDSFDARLRPDRTIVAIEATPSRSALSRLVGSRGGGRLRLALEQFVPEERRQATPLYLILDDISGASLISVWAWSQWDSQWLSATRGSMTESQWAAMLKEKEGICTGFAPGSSSLDIHRISDRTGGTPTTDLRHPDDPQGWHELTIQNSVGMRRARRIDVTLGEVIDIDAAFQDSAARPDGTRSALHEYQLTATADPATLRLLSLAATPRVLPFSECPRAVNNIARLAGSRLSDLRQTVLDVLPGTLGCTHLNDALRALAEVPALVDHIREAAPAS